MDELAAYRRINWSSLTATHAQQAPEAAALRFRGSGVSWAELDERASRLAAWLRARGVGAGDRIALLALNRPEFVEMLVAAARVGAIGVPLNFRLSPGELRFILDDATPKVAVVEGSLLDGYAASGYADAELLVLDETYEDALAGAAPEQILDDVDDNATALIMYTSGTTGRPKGAMLSHLNLFVQGITNIRSFELFGDDVILIATPLFHIAAVSGLLPVFICGGTAVVHPVGAFDADELLGVLERERVTSTFLVPAQWQAIVDVPGVEERKLSLRNVSWGAAPATSTLLARMGEVFEDALNVAVFGQTEMSPVTCSLRGADARRKLGSVGRPLPYVQMRIVDADGGDVPPGEVGEAIYRGPTMMAGYWNRPEADRTAFAGGWFHSGDLVRADEEGFVYVVDRLKDMIISGGENIYCAEVEDAVAAHPSVLEVAVVGRASVRWGEEPVAVVVLRPEAGGLELAALREWLADRLAGYKHPKGIVVADVLPRNASGKVQKYVLRDSVAAAAGGPVTAGE